jgi:peptidoglycan-N-acetylglucosamine deacetylase
VQLSYQCSSHHRLLLRRLVAMAIPRRFLLTGGPSASRQICLTFDDGPHPEHTAAVLDVLKRYKVPASFFVIGEHAQEWPDLVRRIAAEGHVVANHSHSHGRPDKTSARQLLEEVCRTEEYLASLLSIRPRLFRPPYGKASLAKLWLLWRSGHAVVLWNVDPKDFACHSTAEIRAWFRQRPLRGGDLVLLHDTCPHTAALLPELVEEASRRGLGFTTPCRWLGRAYFANR